MRRLLLCVLAAGASAQTTPDPPPPHRYYPLAVGNEWEHVTCAPDVLGTCVYTRSRDSITEAVDVAGGRYFRRVSEAAAQGEPWRLQRTALIRFDTALSLRSGPSWKRLNHPSPARSAQTLGAGAHCAPCRWFRVSRDAGRPRAWSKSFTPPTAPRTTSEGPVPPGAISGTPTRICLTHASSKRTGRFWSLDRATSSRPKAAPRRRPRWPRTPTLAPARPLAVTLDVPGPVTVEAFDALGRRCVAPGRRARHRPPARRGGRRGVGAGPLRRSRDGGRADGDGSGGAPVTKTGRPPKRPPRPAGDARRQRMDRPSYAASARFS